MENQEILILKKIKNQKENPTQKNDKNKNGKEASKRSLCQKNSTIK